MIADYHVHVHETGLPATQTPQERIAQRLDQCMHSPYTLHIVLGRNGCEELLFVECQRIPSDGRIALHEACGFYAYRTGQWPDFFSFQREIRKIQAHGIVLPSYLEFAQRRKMLVLTKKDMETHDHLVERSKSDKHLPKSRRRKLADKSALQILVA